jgi:hypothetical protein
MHSIMKKQAISGLFGIVQWVLGSVRWLVKSILLHILLYSKYMGGES